MYYIYEIKNKINGKTYIGQRLCPKNKFPETDTKYMGSGKFIKHSENKYGIENFSKSILAVTETKENVDILEKFFIALYRSEGKAEYNISAGGDGGCGSGELNPFYGKHHSEETKKKLSEVHKGKYSSEETRRKLSETRMDERNHNFGKPLPESVRKKISESEKGRKISEEHKQILLKYHLGVKQSDETIRKRVEKLRGQKRSEESKRKMREARKNYKISEETKRKISESCKGKISWNKGIKYTKEQKINLRSNCGENNPFYGKHHSEDAKLKNRLAHIGRHHSEETKRRISKTLKLKKLKEKENGIIYRKSRPSNFEEIVGNENAVKGLRKELENGSHVFLFVGPAGCGKTTLARIVAKEVGASDLCINEINSAENRGIETARDILEKMKYNPSQGDAIVWILDEMHMITNAGQNALLKALEEVPESVYFLLCTTDPQKLIKPLVSRCSIVNVSPLTDEEMKYLLKRTARAEGVKISSEVCEKIIEIAQGGSRKALKLLAKVIGLDSDEEKLSILKKETVSENEESIELCRALLKKDTNFQTLASILKKIDVDEPEKIRQGIMGYMNAVLLNGNRFSPEAAAAIQAFSQADTYRNGKNAITVALLDYIDLLG